MVPQLFLLGFRWFIACLDPQSFASNVLGLLVHLAAFLSNTYSFFGLSSMMGKKETSTLLWVAPTQVRSHIHINFQMEFALLSLEQDLKCHNETGPAVTSNCAVMGRMWSRWVKKPQSVPSIFMFPFSWFSILLVAVNIWLVSRVLKSCFGQFLLVFWCFCESKLGAPTPTFYWHYPLNKLFM